MAIINAVFAPRLLTLFLLLLLPVELQAQFNFTTNNGAITITEYTGSATDVIIPGSINGYPVTSIGFYAFASFFSTPIIIPRLTSVIIPDSVTNIGGAAFYNCTNLHSVTFGTNLATIGDGAFNYCRSLTNITLPGSIISLGSGVFAGCISLKAITVDAPDPVYVSSVDGVLFNHSQTTLIQYPGGKAGSYTIPDSVTNIADSAFLLCINLTNLTIPNTITSIGAWMFDGCYNLANVSIPNSVTNIGNYAFVDCSNLTGVMIPNSVTTIGDYAFESCGLTNITIPNSVTNIGYATFYNCTDLIGVTIGNSVTNIGDYAFYNCGNLIGVTLPSSVTSIGEYTFFKCSSLTAITVAVPNSVYSSVAGVLFNQSQTTLIQYPEGKAGSYTVPNNVTIIGDYAFNNCVNLTGVMMPDSVTSIGDYAFDGCGLTNVTIPNKVTNIGDSAFFYCSNLIGVTIGNSVTNIGNYAFYLCVNLTSVTIPNSVISIGDYAFEYCGSLVSAFFQGNAPSADSTLFYGDNMIVYYLPGTTGWGTTFGGVPTVLWNPQAQNDASFGVHNNQFGFNVTGSSNLVIVVEACTDLSNPVWQPVHTNTLTGGTSYFSDPQWTNYPGRFYRLRSP